MKERIVFFGAGQYVSPIIETLNKNFDLVLVVTTEQKATDPVVSYCKASNIELLSVLSFSPEIVNSISSIVNVRIAVLASFGLIVPDEVLNIFEYGILNIHPSLLPKYRGPTPVQSAILNGEQTTGVSIIKLDEQVDHGSILAQAKMPLDGTETAGNLSKKLFLLGGDMVIKIVRKIEKGLKIIEKEQDHSKASFTEHLTRESGFLDFAKYPQSPKSPQLLDRMIRAYYPWPGVWFRYQCEPSQREGSLLDGKIIKLFPENKIQVEGKRVMDFKDFINGYPEGKEILNKLNMR